jgi:PAS domain-containing protein
VSTLTPIGSDDGERSAEERADAVEHERRHWWRGLARLLPDAARRARAAMQAMTQVVGEARVAVSFSHAILDTALANLSQGISVVDGELRLVAWNQRYEQLLGRAFCVKRPVADLFATTRSAVCSARLGRGISQRRLDHLPHKLCSSNWPDGTVINRATDAGGGFVTTTDIALSAAPKRTC